MVTHAAGESAHPKPPAGTYAVVLQADKPGLRALSERLEAASVPHTTITESDPPYVGELVAVGVNPTERRKVKKYLSSLPLLR